MKKTVKTEFKPIKGYPGYFAGSNGKIYRHNSKKMKPLVMYIYGYSKFPEVYLCHNNERKKFFVYQLIVKAFAVSKFSNYRIKLIDGNPLNNSPDNIIVKKLSHKIKKGEISGDENYYKSSVKDMMFLIKRDRTLCGSNEEWNYIRRNLLRKDYKFRYNWLKIYIRSMR
ncbi:MAG: hypothetical protein IAE65_11530 [Ignavibacteria bacterium]|nr:hypothetical protein [Ignavibacteria bacterium]